MYGRQAGGSGEMLPAATGGVTQGMTAELRGLWRHPSFWCLPLVLQKKKTVETKAEEEFVAICFENVYSHFSCQDYVSKSIARLFMRKCVFSLKVEVLDK